MAVYMNAKGTMRSDFQLGKRGNKIFGGTTTPLSDNVSAGDIWLDKTSGIAKIAEVSGNTVTWSSIVTQGDVITATDVTVEGNLTVNGTTTTINTQTLSIEDNILVLNSGFTGADNIVDAGFEVERGDEPSVSFLWDESEGEWTLGSETLVAGGFIGDLHGNVIGSLRPNGQPNTVTANTLNAETATITSSIDLSSATITGVSTDSVTEGSNLYYTDTRARESISSGDGIVYNNSTGVISVANLTVNEFNVSSYNSTGDEWSDNDSTFATTAAISDRIDSQIVASGDIVHITGAETITGDKTISGANLTLTANSTLDVTNATITGANTDSVSEGSNLYHTVERVRDAITVTDDSGQLTYSNTTGVISFVAGNVSAAGSNTQIQYNDEGSISASSGLTFDKSSDTLTTGMTKSISFGVFTDYDNIVDASDISSDLGSIVSRIDARIDQGLLVSDYGLPMLPSYRVSSLPVNASPGAYVFCPDETGGATIVFYDGSNWRRTSDNGIAS